MLRTPVIYHDNFVLYRPTSGSVFMVSLQPISATSAYPLLPSQVVSICDLQRLALYWFHAPGLQLDNEVSLSNCQWTSHTEPSATSTTVTGPVGERLQAGTEDAPVLDRPAPLRRLRDSGAGYKCPDLLTYLGKVWTLDIAPLT